jgi:hypothetical protein
MARLCRNTERNSKQEEKERAADLQAASWTRPHIMRFRHTHTPSAFFDLFVFSLACMSSGGKERGRERERARER